MNCTDALGLMQALVDGELSADEREALTDHIEGCDTCRQACEERQRFIAAAAEALNSQTTAPPGIAATVMRQVSEEPIEARDGAQPPMTTATGVRRLGALAARQCGRRYHRGALRRTRPA